MKKKVVKKKNKMRVMSNWMMKNQLKKKKMKTMKKS